MNTLQFQLFALRTLFYLHYLMENIWTYGKLFFHTMMNPEAKGVYVFFDGYTTAIPYVSYEKLPEENGFAKVTWKYDKNEKTLVYKECDHLGKKHLPWLSAVIHSNNSQLCNLDDFVSTLQVQTNGPVPSPKMVIACWSLESNLYFEVNSNVEIIVITDMGEEKQYSIWNDEPIPDFA